MDPAKLKVTQLREELQKRGLDTKGNKAVLVDRLRKALENDTDNSNENSTEIDNDDTGSQDDDSESSKTVSPVKTPGRSSRSQASPKITPTRGSPKVLLSSPGSQKVTTPVKSSVVEDEVQTSTVPDEDKSVDTEENKVDDESAVISTSTTTTTSETSETAETSETIDDKVTETEISESTISKDAQEPVVSSTPSEEIIKEQTNEIEQKIEPVISEVTNETLVDTEKSIDEEKKEEQQEKEEEKEQQDNKEQDQAIEIENKEKEQDNNKDIKSEEELSVKVDETLEKLTEEEIKVTTSDENISENNENSENNNNDEEKMETNELDNDNSNNDDDNLKIENDNIKEDVKENLTNVKMEADSTDVKLNIIENDDDKNKLKDDIKNENNNDNDIEMKTDIKNDDKDKDKDTKDVDRKDRKDRKRKRSSSSQDERQKTPPPQSHPEDEPEIDNSRVLLSWYDSDLNLIIDKTKFLSATPMHNDGFSYVWAGARASYGFTSGKLYYEVKITNECNVTIQDEQDPHVLRAGWSLSNTSLQLGEDKYTYGYGGTGKISTNLEFNDYGPKFGLNDILTCFIDFTDNDNIIISYKLNGKDLGTAFTILKNDIQNKPLYPHILTKNCGFVCNFGDEKSWTDDIPDDYIPLSKVDIKERIIGPQRPDKREDCQVLMLIGLPASGKTVWANKYAQDNPDKLYNVLGTNSLIDKMRVSGLARKKAYNTRWDTLFTKCNKCLTTLLDVASHRRRNYILDQTNVYPSAQRRKMRHFYGFQRKAIVVVPTDEEFKSRTAKREADEGKDVPDNNILEMKANFEAPNVGESFDAVEWIELNEEEGKKLISKYNKEGKDAGYGQQPSKRSRFDKTNDSHRDNRDVRSSRDSRDSRDHRDSRRNTYSDRNRNSTWRGGSQMGMRHSSSSGYGSSSGGGGGWRDRGSSNSSYRGSSGGYGSSSSGGYRGRGGSSNTPYRNNDRRGPSSDRRTSGNDRRISSSRQGGWGPMNSNYNNSNSSNWGNSSHGSGWSGNSSSSSSSQQQSSWSSGQPNSWSSSSNSNSGQGGNWGGSWKGYGSNSNYNQTSYGSGQTYGNGSGSGGNWGSWNNPSQQQYYGQYWGQSQGQSSTSGQTTSGSSSTSAPSSGTTTSSYNNYPANWGSYSGSYNYTTDSTNPSTQK